MVRPLLNVLSLARFPIFNQLLLEEALFRSTKSNWLIINDGAFMPAIVMGISGKPAELIHVESASEARVQVIKRFTGGGTVVVDQDTIFVTLIMEGVHLPDVLCFPQPIMKWTESLYAPVFSRYGDFKLQENDYAFNHVKFGGNAQAISGKRWLHHTSFLWDFQPARMQLLKHPPKAPQYRQGREHGDFVVKLKDHVSDRHQLIQQILDTTRQLDFKVQVRSLPEVAAEAMSKSSLVGSKLVDLKEWTSA